MKTIGMTPKNRRTLTVISIAAVCFLVLSFISAGLMSKQPSGSETAAASMDTGVAGMAAKTIASVVVVLGLLYASMYAMKVISRKTGKGGVKNDVVAVLHRTHIAPKKAIYIIKIANRAMVVGVTDVQISHLADLSEEEAASIKGEQPTKTFREHLFSVGLGKARR
jgi:flagellar biogenesis protein FliO